MAMSSISCILRLLLLILTSSQRLDSPDGDCDGGFVCKSTQDCPSYLVKKEQADSLKSQGAAEYEAVLKELKDMVCNKAKRGVCCEESYEVVNGKIVKSVGECRSSQDCRSKPELEVPQYVEQPSLQVSFF